MISSLRKLLLAAVLVGLLRSNASAGDKPPPGRYIEVEIERDTGKDSAPPLLDEATLEKFRKWRFKPEKVRRLKIPMMYRYIPPAMPSALTVSEPIDEATAPRQNNLSVFATTPCRGLSLSR